MTVASTIDLLQEGVSLHRRGAVAEAAARYSEVLRRDPANADAHYYLGMLACQQQLFAEGAEHARQALANDPRHARAHVLLGRALSALGRNAEALACFDRAIASAPDLAPAHSHRADVLSDMGRTAEAVESYDRALALTPDAVEDWFNRGVALAALGRHQEALASFDRAIALHPGAAQPHLHRAKALSELRRQEAALQAVDSALAVERDLPDAWLGRGNILHGLKRSDDALAAYDRASTLKPDLAAAWLGRGNVLCERRQFADALSAYDRALAIEPDLAGAWLGRGNVFRELRRYDDALTAYDKALAFNSDFADAWYGRGNILFTMRRDLEALSCFDRAISLNKDFAEAYYANSLAKLVSGDYGEGWQQYEWRWRSRLTDASRRSFDQPLWLGDRDLANQTILIHAEQGFGDTIQFCRYLKLFDRQKCRIVFEVAAALLPLLRERREGIQIIARGDPLPDFDLHCPLMSLPLAFKTGLQTVPAEVPYLFVSEGKRKQWRDRLGARNRPRIGLAWSGNPQPDPGRSIRFGNLSPLLLDEVEWHALQKEVREEDRPHLGHARVADHSRQLADFSDTAALIAEMDLVISIDTAAAHLAGALGKEVWIMLPAHADFRWLRERQDCPWYPTARLFRQAEADAWGQVVNELAKQLTSRYSPSRQGR